LQTPFKQTIWLDLDCEILGSIEHLYRKMHQHSKLALVFDEEMGYNSGVIVYDASSPLLANWADACIRKNNQFLGDQDILTHLIQEGEIEIAELPEKYNWVVKGGIHPEAVILHWSGSWGKQIIRNKVSAA
jgi:lipopolysaccharide biosynthesis glycosyltransferase